MRSRLSKQKLESSIRFRHSGSSSRHPLCIWCEGLGVARISVDGLSARVRRSRVFVGLLVEASAMPVYNIYIRFWYKYFPDAGKPAHYTRETSGGPRTGAKAQSCSQAISMNEGSAPHEVLVLVVCPWTESENTLPRGACRRLYPQTCKF